jgi:disulfide bond formation protein DsbB
MSKNKLYFLGLIGLATIAISFAFFVEYILGFEPCILCLYQRVPYYLLMLIGIGGLILPNAKYLIYLAMLVFGLSAILAGYHTGIERELFSPSNTCNPGFTIPADASAVEMREMLYNVPVATCTRAAFKVLGISMTEWNLILNLSLLMYSIWFIKRR